MKLEDKCYSAAQNLNKSPQCSFIRGKLQSFNSWFQRTQNWSRCAVLWKFVSDVELKKLNAASLSLFRTEEPTAGRHRAVSNQSYGSLRRRQFNSCVNAVSCSSSWGPVTLCAFSSLTPSLCTVEMTNSDLRSEPPVCKHETLRDFRAFRSTGLKSFEYLFL